MLKVAKGFERQRMAKRLRDPKSTPEKRVRIEKEIAVLKVRRGLVYSCRYLCAYIYTPSVYTANVSFRR